MFVHRRHVPFLIILSLFQLGTNMALFTVYSNLGDSVFSISLGILTGGVVSYALSSWIIRHQSSGIVHLKLGPLSIIAIFIIGLGLLVLQTIIDHKLLSSLCTVLGSKMPDICDAKLSVFISSSEVFLICSLYIWGLFYEKKSGCSLIYRIAFFEK